MRAEQEQPGGSVAHAAEREEVPGVVDLLERDGWDVVLAELGHEAAESPADALVAELDGGAYAVIDLGSSDYDSRAARRESATESAAVTLAIADRLAVPHVVFVSSAMVYGAAGTNPVPLTEDAALRPDVEFVFARQLASAEELLEQWRSDRPGRTTSVLRPALALAAEEIGDRVAKARIGDPMGRHRSTRCEQFLQQYKSRKATATCTSIRWCTASVGGSPKRIHRRSSCTSTISPRPCTRR